MEDPSFREAGRVTSLRLKIKRQDRWMEALEKTVALHDVLETKGISV
jgi:hypothetical protein